MNEDQQQQSKFEGYAVVEIYGHTKAAGFVTTDYFGSACLFRIDTPALPAREYELTRPEHHTVGGCYVNCPIGTKVMRPESPARTVFYGTGSIFSMTPCTEEVMRKAMEAIYPRPVVVLSMPERAQIPSGEDIDVDEEPEF